MVPHVFADQLKRAFSMNLRPPELGALMAIFDPEMTGAVTCQSFLNKFLKVGMESERGGGSYGRTKR